MSFKTEEKKFEGYRELIGNCSCKKSVDVVSKRDIEVFVRTTKEILMEAIAEGKSNKQKMLDFADKLYFISLVCKRDAESWSKKGALLD